MLAPQPGLGAPGPLDQLPAVPQHTSFLPLLIAEPKVPPAGGRVGLKFFS